VRRWWPFGQRNWRTLTLVTIGTIALAWPLSQLPLLPGAKATLADTVLIFSATLFGIVPLLANAAVVTAIHITSGTATPAPFTECLVLFGAAWLLRSRVPITLGVVLYTVMQVALLALFAASAAELQPSKVDAQVLAAIVNFALASLALSCLPRHSRRWPRLLPKLLRWVPRRSLAKMVFSTATVTTMLSLVVITHVTRARAGQEWNPTLLITAVVATGILAALAHIASSSMSRIADRSFAKLPRQRDQRRPSLASASAEAADAALRWLRRLYQLQRLVQRSNRELTAARGEGARYRTEVLNLTARVKEQTQTQQRDVSSLQDMGKKLEETQSTIEHVRTHHKLFIAMMSHEVRTPLHGLMSTLSLLREEALSAEGERQLSIARTSARALLKIANDILDLSRIEAGGFSFESKPFNPRRLVDEIIAEFLATAQAQRLDLGARIGDNVPSALVGDRNRIYQIVSNLVSNAVKFTPTGRVTVRVSYDEGTLTIDVIDTGAGIPPEKREAIFDSFVQADAAHNRRFAGSGLGLTISRHLAQAMGGSLRLHASGRGGSTFRLQIALGRSEEEAIEEQSQRILAHPTGHILVVEDNDVNQYVARVMLENLGCTVSIAENGTVALETARRERFDLVLMDCELPGMDGYEASARMRSDLQLQIPIIAMTANALPADRERARQAGMNDYLTKPFTKGALSRLLNQWLPTAGGQQDDEAAWPALDLAVLQELWESVGWRTSALRKIYESFIANVRSAIHLLETDTPPLPQVRRSLHTIRGSGGMVGAMSIARTVATLEQALANDQLTPAAIQAADLPRELREFEAALEQRLATHGDAPQPRR
jgi:signal transduction histidine kinase/CheY-like chemotaxis protein